MIVVSERTQENASSEQQEIHNRVRNRNEHSTVRTVILERGQGLIIIMCFVIS